ncbi:leucine-rich colipase-like protein 1 [Dipodomys merriami]|uniref:leucine-rich colipase-like protein 1 n=1 Tax=Dipodomys merriami TaxID=94247 RepID=UPI003856064F
MAGAAEMLLLLLLGLLLPQEAPTSLQSRKGSAILSHKENGEACGQHSECQTNCCVRTSLNRQKFCTTKNLFQQCLPWRKPNGHRCSRHKDCYSDCCVQTGRQPDTFCTTKTMLQCVAWRKPDRDLCSSHNQCWSLCCIQMGESSRSRCWPRTGFLAQCLPL